MMSDSKPISKHVCFFFLLFLCVSTSFKLCCSTIVCPEIEKQALLKFKQSLNDSSNVLSSWNISREDNCCMWKGVVCSNLTGHIHQLHLQNRYYSQFDGLSGQLNPSLLNLKELEYLDLSQNYFGVRIPSFLGFLTSLEYLNLSYAGFYGRIPYNIGNLSNLHTLSLDGNGGIDVDSMEWVSGLPRLEYLNMNEVNLSKATNWDQVIGTLPSLVELYLSDCNMNSMAPLKHVNTTLTILDLSYNYFDYIPAPRWIFQIPSLIELHLSYCYLNVMAPLKHFNTTSLTILDLSWNEFASIPLPSWIFQQHNLISLDLSNNGFDGPVPSISNSTKLKLIDLSYNSLTSSIPNWLYFCKELEYVFMSSNSLIGKISSAIGNLTSLRTIDLSTNELYGDIPNGIVCLCNLQKLDLSMNKLEGKVSDAFGNMSNSFLEALTSLRLSYNQLFGHLTPQFGEFKRLQILDLLGNSISGAIPINIGKLSCLSNLDIGYNKLSGNLPESLGQLFNLAYLNIEHNMLEGMVTETHFSNLSNLRYLSASGNHLSLKISSNWVPPFTLVKLALRSWNLGADSIPSWIDTQNRDSVLDLSNTGISGNIPTWIWKINHLNLSHNNLHGQIPYIIGPQVCDLNSNQFSGSLPRVANINGLDLSNNKFTGGMSHFLCDATYKTYQMRILHLGGNQLNGELPDCFMKWPSLTVLNLANNNLSGKIPNSIEFLADLESFNLHGNNFYGQIPLSMHNCTSLLKLDLGGNGFSGNIPAWMGTSFGNLMFLILRSNKLSGEIPSDICHLNALQILDLSSNEFSGVIPDCVKNFTAMATERSLNDLTYTMNDYTGFINEDASVVTKGRMYEYDTILSLVTNIDLSNNNLSGYIPKELTSLVELRSLNLSGNRLTGSIPDRMGDMKQLESLDLSRNSLLGEIPNSFTLMFYLSYLDLSFNNLTGRIPSSTQIMGMDASRFVGNHLCGPPLPTNCSNGDPSPFVEADDHEGGESRIEWLYLFLSLGYAVGLSACFTALVLKKSWRDAYFGLMECIWNKLYVYFRIKWTRLTTTRAPLS